METKFKYQKTVAVNLPHELQQCANEWALVWVDSALVKVRGFGKVLIVDAGEWGRAIYIYKSAETFYEGNPDFYRVWNIFGLVEDNII